MALLIKNGTIVNHDYSHKADILCVSGKVSKIGQGIEAPQGARVIDAEGMLLMPGGIDAHTHLQMPFMGTVTVDDWASGTRCAIAGGTTTIIDFIIPPKGSTLMAAFEEWKKRATTAVCNYGFHCAIPFWNKSVSEEYEALVKAGVTSCKHFLAYKGALMLNDSELIESFSRCKELGILPSVHAENGDLVWWKQRQLIGQGITGPIGHPLSRPASTEVEAAGRACTIARQVGVPLVIVHNTCKGSVDSIRRAQKSGQPVFGEVTAIHLTIDDSQYANPDWKHAAHHVLSPPLRTKNDVEYLWDALHADTIQYTATDHCSFTTAQKMMGKVGGTASFVTHIQKEDFTKIPNGCPGLEERLMLVWQQGVASGRMTPERFVEVTSAFAAKLYNMYPQKGAILEGSDADIVIWNPNKPRTISVKSKIDYNVYEGFVSAGSPAYTILNGIVAYENGKVVAKEGDGKYVHRKPFGFSYGVKHFGQ